MNESNKFNFPLKDVDVVDYERPPYTSKDKRGKKFDDKIKEKMDERELWIKDEVEEKDQKAVGVH